jgi:hypothetical protein
VDVHEAHLIKLNQDRGVLAALESGGMGAKIIKCAYYYLISGV